MGQLSILDRALVFYGTYLPNHPRKWWVHERLRKLLRANPQGEREVVREGFRWSLDPADFEHAGYFWMGKKDPWDIYHILRLVPKDAVIFDIGANFGYYTVRLARELGSSCRIHAFEPNPRTHDRLLKHVAWNQVGACVEVHQLGVSDRSGEAVMVERPDNSGASRIGQEGEQGITIKLTSLDDFVETNQITRVDLMKIDVEGLEERLIMGAGKLISQFRPIILIELWPPGLAKAGSTVQAVVDRIRAHNYDAYEARHSELVPLAELPTGQDPINVFFLPSKG